MVFCGGPGFRDGGGATAAGGNEFLLGACTHYAQDWERVDMSLPLLIQAGMSSIRDELTWQYVEWTKARLVLPPYYEKFAGAVLKAKLTPLFVLDYGNKHYDGGGYPRSDTAVRAFCRYAAYIARKFRGRHVYYEVWNEWDNRCGNMKGPGRDAATYANLLEAVYPVLKSTDPGCTVLGVGVSGAGIGDKTEKWVRDLLEAGALKSMDGFSIHPYSYSDSAETYFNRFPAVVDKLAAVLDRFASGKRIPIYITEIGWSLSRVGNDPERQAAYLARFLLLAKTRPRIRGAWIYNLTDCVPYAGTWWTPDAAQRNFGLLRQDYTPKPAYWAVRDLSALVRRGRYIGTLETGKPAVYALRFQLDGNPVLALWTVRENGVWRVMFSRKGNASRPGTVRFRKVGHGAGVQIPWFAGKQFSAFLDKTPVLLEGFPENAEIANLKWFPYRGPERPSPGRSVEAVPLDKAAPLVWAPRRDGLGPVRAARKAWQSIRALRLQYEPLAARGGGQEKPPVSGTVKFAWDGSALRIFVDVTDPNPAQPFRGPAIWGGDSLQVGLLGTGARKDYCELGVALDQNGKVLKACWHVSRALAQNGGSVEKALGKIRAAVKRDSDSWLYELAIPFDSVFLPKRKRGDAVRAAVVVNNNDGNGRTGYLRWAAGIAREKNPVKFGKLILAGGND